MRNQKATKQIEQAQNLCGNQISQTPAAFVNQGRSYTLDLTPSLWQKWERKCLRLGQIFTFLLLISASVAHVKVYAQNKGDSHAKVEDLFGDSSASNAPFEGIDLGQAQLAQGKSELSDQERAMYEAAVLQEAAKLKHLIVSSNRNDILKLVACLIPKDEALKFKWQDGKAPTTDSTRSLLEAIYADATIMSKCESDIESLRANIKPIWFAMVRQLALYTFTTSPNRQLAFLKLKNAVSRGLRCKTASGEGCRNQDYVLDSFLPAKVGSPLNEMEAFGDEEWRIGLFDFAVFNSDLKPADWNFLFNGKLGPVGLREWLKTSCGSDERGKSRIRLRYEALMEAENLKRTEFNTQNPTAVPLKMFKADALHIEDICGVLNLKYDFHKSVFFWDKPNPGRLTPAEVMMLLSIWANGVPFEGLQHGGAEERDTYAYKRILWETLRPLSLQTREHEAIRSAKDLFIQAPYAALATNVSPSNAQLQTVALYMLDRAQKAVSENESLILRLSSGDLTRREALKLVGTEKLVQAVLRFKEGNESYLYPFRNQVDFAGDIIPKMQKEHAHWELGISGIEMSIIVVGNLVCVAPWGGWWASAVAKFPKLAKLTLFAVRTQRADQIWKYVKGFASPVCINGFNLSVGVYFVSHSYVEYMSMYNSIYSSVVNEGSLYGIDDLTMQEKWLVVDAASVLSGTTLLKYATNKFRGRISMAKFSKLARQADELKRLVPQVQ